MIYYNYDGFESNCKRIAKKILKEADDVYGTAIALGKVYVYCSKKMAKVFLDTTQRKRYINEINKILKDKGCSIDFDRVSIIKGYVSFLIAFDEEEIDAETEDW